MTERNSYAEFILGAYKALLVDCASHYPGLTKEFDRDFQRLSSAAESHGIRFFLDTMPAYRKHLDTCLDERRLTQSHLIHFGSWTKGGVIPRLFRGLFLRVFDLSGNMRSSPDIEAIRLLRQLLGVVRKLRLESSLKDRGNAVIEFNQIDDACRGGDLDWSDSHRFSSADAKVLSFEDLSNVKGEPYASDLFGSLQAARPSSELLRRVQHTADLLASMLGVFTPEDWAPRHGPGVVSDIGYTVNKYSFTRWPERLDHVFPYDAFAVANASWVKHDQTSQQRYVSENPSHPARLIAVAKTIKTPRLIASEPSYLQWTQQVVRDYMASRIGETLIGNFIDFRRQELNGDLALAASSAGKLSTIDLSSASDRISCWHVERLFRRLPCLLDALQATRSAHLVQDICRYSPRHRVLKKYSTMGNATTFPVQSIFFLSIALGCVLYKRGLQANFKNLKMLGKRQVRVFGDDIIVPTDCSGLVVETLQALSLRVNVQKSFTKGQFRESCGVDAFSGHDVTTVNILEVPRSAGPGSIVSAVDVHHNLCSKGYIALAQYVQKTAARIVSNRIRYVKHGSGLFGWSDLFGTTSTKQSFRWNRNLHRLEVKTLRTRVREEKTEPEDAAGLLQFFTEAQAVVQTSVSSLGTRSRRPQTKLGLGWVSVH